MSFNYFLENQFLLFSVTILFCAIIAGIGRLLEILLSEKIKSVIGRMFQFIFVLGFIFICFQCCDADTSVPPGDIYEYDLLDLYF